MFDYYPGLVPQGHVLRKRRIDAGLTRKQVAGAVVCSESYVYDIEEGRTRLQGDIGRRYFAYFGGNPEKVKDYKLRRHGRGSTKTYAVHPLTKPKGR